ncbi:MAG TPA: ABC transporter permease [Chthoniobacterales bacterium]|nr:ABC transporter permease [Chthoniobacterales bacterium]
MNGFLRDLFYSARLVAKSPTFTIAVVLSLAIGIGANAAIFSLLNGVLLKPLPFEDSGRLVVLWEKPSRQRELLWDVSGPNYKDWVEQARVFDGLSASTAATEATLATNYGAERIGVRSVSGSLFSILRLKPRLGRWFVEDELGTEERSVAIIGDALWKRHFASRHDVIGQKITVDRETYNIVGVAPPIFESFGFRTADVILPLRFNSKEMQNRDLHLLTVIGRLKSAVTLAETQAQMNNIAAQLAKIYPGVNGVPEVKMTDLLETRIGGYRGLLVILQAAIVFVLLIACTNVASLLLARWTGRQQELAIRAALGATRWSILRLSASESIILVFGGTVLGIWIADGFRRAVLSVAPADIPRLAEVRIDTSVLFGIAALSAGMAIFFAIVPLLFSGGIQINDWLRQSDRSGGAGLGRQRLRGFLVTSQVVLTVVLLSGAGLLIRSLWRLQQTDIGFQSGNLLSFHLFPQGPRYKTGDQIATFYAMVFDRLKNTPGIGEVAAVSHLPFTSGAMGNRITQPGRAQNTGEQMDAQTVLVTPEYFRTLGVRITLGRSFTVTDVQGAPPVIMINEHLGRQLFPSESPIGKQLEIEPAERLDPDNVEPRVAQIVGVVASGKQWDVTEQPHNVVYIPFAQSPVPSMFVVAETRTKSPGLADRVRDAILKLDPSQPVYDMEMMAERIRASQLARRFNGTLLVLFAMFALVATAVGIYGTLAFWVAQRTREIALRMAIGANRQQVMSLVFRKVAGLLLVGFLVGLPASVGLVRVVRSAVYQGQPSDDIFYGVAAFDPLTMCSVLVVLIGSAALATIIPAWRATRIDPARMLQAE